MSSTHICPSRDKLQLIFKRRWLFYYNYFNEKKQVMLETSILFLFALANDSI